MSKLQNFSFFIFYLVPYTPIDSFPKACKRNMIFAKFSYSPVIVDHCHPDCLTCSQSPDHCDLCQDPTKLLRNGRCVHSCGLGFYQAGALCLGMISGRPARGGLEFTIVKGSCIKEMFHFLKPLERNNIFCRLLGL